MIALAAAAITVTINFTGTGSPFGPSAKPKVLRSLAVLPLRPLSSDSDQSAFAWGLTDVLTTELEQISGLRVVPHSGAEPFGNSSKPLPEIAKLLDEFLLPVNLAQRFANSEITNQELIDKSQVLVNGVRIALNLQLVE